MHPLVTPLLKTTDKDLSEKILDLQRRLNVAYRLGKGELINQLHMILEDYTFEHQKRMDKQMAEMLEKNKKNIKDIIDIK